MIDGKSFHNAIISGANNIAKYRELVDALNVFPVPDGDTGTNMSMTFGAAKRELIASRTSSSLGDSSKQTAAALLRGARGNSGVILSLLFRGMSKGFAGVQVASSNDIIVALKSGVDAAYKAVMKPTEGTMLTVARMGTEAAEVALKENTNITPVELWSVMTDGAREALELTPELLPVLKNAGVVDAGGKGLLLIYEGMDMVFRTGELIEESDAVKPIEDYAHDAAAEFEGEITFTYCTEFIVLKDESRANALALRAFLESIGDSAVVVEDDDIIKIHVHTDNPGNALQKGLEMGGLTNIKIDNMREQHASKQRAAGIKDSKTKFDYQPVDNQIEVGFVSVAAGEGVQSLFKDLAVNNIVSGGQTMNPSTDDILEAVHATPARNVIVLPNNKNIIMAAEQAEKLADRKVHVLPTRSIPQGIAAMLAFDSDKDLSKNKLAMVNAADKVGTGLITFAARDSSTDGHKIKKGEILALENGKLAFSDKDLEKSVVRLVRSLLKRGSSFVTLIYGEDVSVEQAVKIEELVRERLPEDIEVALVEGKQPVYYFIISVE